MSQVLWERAAQTALTRYSKDDPAGVDQVLDSVSLLPSNPQPPGVLRCGDDRYRIHVGRYRVWYTLRQRRPVIIAVDLVGRVR